MLTQPAPSQVDTVEITVGRGVRAASPSPSGVDSGGAESTQRRHQATAPSQGAAETRRRRRIQAPAAAPSPKGVSTQAAPSLRSRPDTMRRRRVKALQRPNGGEESRRRRVPAVMTQAAPSPRFAGNRRSAESRRCRDQAAAQNAGGAESQVPTAESRRCRDQTAAQSRGGGAAAQMQPSPRGVDSGSAKSKY